MNSYSVDRISNVGQRLATTNGVTGGFTTVINSAIKQFTVNDSRKDRIEKKQPLNL